MSEPQQARYSFLDILSESEGLARGANLSEKVNHGVYKALQTMTTVAHARRNQLFTLDTEVPDIINLTRKDLGAVVGRLMGDRMVAQIFRLEFDPDKPEPALVSCFIAYPADEKANPALIYNESVMASVQALESLLTGRSGVDPDTILQDFEADFTTETNRPLALPAHLVDLFSAVHASKFDMVPAPELVQRTIADIQAELLYRGKIHELLNYGLMPMRDAELMERLETAIDFLDAKVVPRYKNKGSLKRALEAIGMEESAYHLDDFVPPTPEFAMRRAEAARAAIQADPGYRGGRFQGGLAIEVILALAPLAKQKYLERHQREIAQAHKDFREKLINISNDWQDTILFLSAEEKEKIPPEVARELAADPELLVGTWHRQEGIVHIFIRSSADAIRAIIRALSIVAPDRAWQALAVKSILEEHEDDFRYLFEDPDFLVSYGSMLRRVYINYIPWYLRLLLSFGLTWFQDYSFQLAKKAIQIQQGSLSVRNREREEERKVEKEAERKEELNRIREVSAANQIIEQLDAAYIERGRLPSMGEIQDAVAAHAKMEEATFQEMLRKENFQVAPMPGKDASPRDAILLYPLNHEWRTRTARLRRLLERIFTDENADPLQADRAKRVQKFLGKIESGGASIPAPKAAAAGGEADLDDEGAFERFGTELEKHEGQKKRVTRDAKPQAEVSTTPDLDESDAPEL